MWENPKHALTLPAVEIVRKDGMWQVTIDGTEIQGVQSTAVDFRVHAGEPPVLPAAVTLTLLVRSVSIKESNEKLP